MVTEQFSERIVVRITPRSRDRLNAAVEASGMPLSDWLRQALEDAIQRSEAGATEAFPDDHRLEMVSMRLDDTLEYLSDAESNLAIEQQRTRDLEHLSSEQSDRQQRADALIEQLTERLRESHVLTERMLDQLAEELSQRQVERQVAGVAPWWKFW